MNRCKQKMGRKVTKAAGEKRANLRSQSNGKRKRGERRLVLYWSANYLIRPLSEKKAIRQRKNANGSIQSTKQNMRGHSSSGVEIFGIKDKTSVKGDLGHLYH